MGAGLIGPLRIGPYVLIAAVSFGLLGVMRGAAFHPEAEFENSVRVVLGGILGWLFFFAFLIH